MFFTHRLSILLALLALDGDSPADGAAGVALINAGDPALFSAAAAQRRWRALTAGT